MNMLEEATISCPYCGEVNEFLIDSSVTQQTYIEDCFVCCRPITLIIDCLADGLSVVARHENDC